MSEPYLGMIILVPYNFAPRGWAFCAGQILPIAQNTALFALLGTTFGGNGQTTFALPDLRGRVPMGAGQGPGLDPYSLGTVLGTEEITLTVNQMPAHGHPATANAIDDDGSSGSPTGKSLASINNGYAAGNPTAVMNAGVVKVANAGGSQPHDNMQPCLALNYCIALEGIFPSRN